MTKLSKALVVAGLSAALVGCGGGSDSPEATTTTTTTETDPDTTAPDAAAAKKRVKASYDVARELVAGLNNRSSEDQQTRANGAVESFREEIQKNPNLSPKDQKYFLGKLKDLQRDLTGIDVIVIDTTQFNNGMRGYIVSPDMTILPDRRGGGDSTLTTTRDGITFTYDGTPAPGKPVSGLPDGWIGSSHQRNYANARRDSGRIFSDRPSAPETWEWDDFWNQQSTRPNSFLAGLPLPVAKTLPPAADGNSLQIAGVSRGNGSANTVTFTVAAAAVGAASFQTALGSSYVEILPAAGGNASLPAWGETMTGTTDYVGALFGIRGLFQCSVACQINNNDGLLEVENVDSGGGVGGTFTLTFTPDGTERNQINSHKFSFTKPDYAEFGYWALEDNDGTVTLSTFARGNYGETSRGLTTNPADITGTATYKGLAAGYYTLSNEGELYNGEFKANAKLTADFDDNTMNGMISGFDSETENAHDSQIMDWKLNLNDANIGTTANSFQNFTGPTTGSGIWQGTLYGNVGTALGTRNNTRDYPKAVVGEFTGDGFDGIPDNRVVGAFGHHEK